MNDDFGTNINDLSHEPQPFLSGAQLAERILGKTVHGQFGPDFRFVSSISAQGEAVGLNNAGTHTRGQVHIDMDRAILTSQWQQHWITSRCKACEWDGVIKFYDAKSGAWAMNFTQIHEGVAERLERPD